MSIPRGGLKEKAKDEERQYIPKEKEDCAFFFLETPNDDYTPWGSAAKIVNEDYDPNGTKPEHFGLQSNGQQENEEPAQEDSDHEESDEENDSDKFDQDRTQQRTQENDIDDDSLETHYESDLEMPDGTSEEAKDSGGEDSNEFTPKIFARYSRVRGDYPSSEEKSEEE